jgi:hypothetical protein
MLFAFSCDAARWALKVAQYGTLVGALKGVSGPPLT